MKDEYAYVINLCYTYVINYIALMLLIYLPICNQLFSLILTCLFLHLRFYALSFIKVNCFPLSRFLSHLHFPLPHFTLLSNS